MDHRVFLRQMLASLAFRFRHAIKDAPIAFEDFEAGMDTRTPEQILNHVNDMLIAVEHRYRGKKPHLPESVPWMEAVERFHSSLDKLDSTITEKDGPEDDMLLRLFQGPLCDAMTHIGQLMMLRRLVGSSVEGANYYRAAIKAGRLGPEQELPV